MQVGPEHRARYCGGGMQHVMMVVPVDAHVNKTQNVAEKYRQQWTQIIQSAAVRHLNLQHHDRDDDCHHAVAECFQPSSSHLYSESRTRTQKKLSRMFVFVRRPFVRHSKW